MEKSPRSRERPLSLGHKHEEFYEREISVTLDIIKHLGS